MSSVSVTLPRPPGIDGGHTYRHASGRPYLTREAVRWHAAAILLVQAAAREQEWQDDPHGTLSVWVRRGDRRDVDSGVKILLDAVCAGLGTDDRRVQRLTVERAANMPRDQVDVVVALTLPTIGIVLGDG